MTTTPVRSPVLLIPLEQRDTMPGFCSRCDRPARLPLGPGTEALCRTCRVAEHADHTNRKARR